MTKTDEIIKKIADKFIAKINNFAGEWERPFFDTTTAAPRNVASKKLYRGLNLVTLWLTAEENKFTSNIWGTFDQWKEKGKSIRKGETGTPIFFWKKTQYTAEVTNESGEIELEERESCVARYYIVFNACQMADYIPEEAEAAPEDLEREIEEFKTNFLNKTGIKYTEEGTRAFYRPKTDEVVLPPLTNFSLKSEYIPTACHEFTHATGAKTRLNRDFSGKFGDAAYAFEELVADIGAGMLSAALGKQYIFQNNNIAYLKSWVEILEDQPKAILKACSYAQKAADYLLELTETETTALENIEL